MYPLLDSLQKLAKYPLLGWHFCFFVYESGNYRYYDDKTIAFYSMVNFRFGDNLSEIWKVADYEIPPHQLE